MSGYLINGVDLETPWCLIADFAATLVEPEGLGTYTRAAGVDGGGFVTKVFPPFEFPIPVTIRDVDDDGVRPATAADRIQQFFDNRAALIAKVRDPDAALDVIRVTGTTWEGARCELASPLEFAMVGESNARCIITLRNLDGLWAPSAGS